MTSPSILFRLAVILTACVVGFSASAQEDGLLHHWTFDGHLQDVISAKPAVKSGEPVFGEGVHGQGLAFAGDSALSHPSGKIGLEAFTISTWVRSYENKLHGRIVEKGASNSFWLYATKGLVVGGFYDAARVKYQDVSSSSELLDGEWHHVVVTFDGRNLSLHLDGELENNVKLPAGSRPNDNAQPFVIGTKYKGFVYDNLVGGLDDVRIYNRALSAEEIAGLFKAKP